EENDEPLQAVLIEPVWQTSQWYGAGDGQEAPLCPKCGQKIRDDASPRPGGIGYANPSWNAGWDGRCEQCGFRFELVSAVTLPPARRSVQVRPAHRFLRTFVDEGTTLAGIEVSVVE